MSAYSRHRQDGDESVRFDNSGDGPLVVPGFGGIPIDVERPPTERFAHASHDWSQPRLTAREMAMLRQMNRITDLPDWHIKVHGDATTVASLRPSPYQAPLISDAAWEWCIAELRDKADTFTETGHVSVFDSGSCLVKSDVLITSRLLEKLQAQVEQLADEARPIQEFLDAVGASHRNEMLEPQSDEDDEDDSRDSGSDVSFPPARPPGVGPVPRPPWPRNAQLLNLVDPSMFL
jgi:uncharacterized protein DUF4246